MKSLYLRSVMSLSNEAVHKITSLILIGILILSVPVYGFSQTEEISSSDGGKISVLLAGGIGHSAVWHGIADLKAEIQFGLTARTKIGLGVGYFGRGNHMSRIRHASGMMGGFGGHSHSLRVIPFTLSLYYGLPAAKNLSIFMVGGGEYYPGSYKDISTKWDSAFGLYSGIGLDLRLADGIWMVAEGVYRFATLTGYLSENHSEFFETMHGDNHEGGTWHHHHHEDELHFHNDLWSILRSYG